MTPFMLFAHKQVWQVGWITGLNRNLFLDVVHRQYFDYSVAFAILAGVLVVQLQPIVWRWFADSKPRPA